MVSHHQELENMTRNAFFSFFLFYLGEGVLKCIGKSLLSLTEVHYLVGTNLLILKGGKMLSISVPYIAARIDVCRWILEFQHLKNGIETWTPTCLNREPKTNESLHQSPPLALWYIQYMNSTITANEIKLSFKFSWLLGQQMIQLFQ